MIKNICEMNLLPLLRAMYDAFYQAMTKEKLNIPTVRSYWIKEAEEALTVAEHLFEKRDFF